VEKNSNVLLIMKNDRDVAETLDKALKALDETGDDAPDLEGIISAQVEKNT